VIWWPATGLEVREAPLADWPDFLTPKPAERENVSPFVPQALEGRGSLDAKVAGIAKRLERAREGERNVVCYWAACRVAELRKEGELAKLVTEGWCADLLALAATRAGLPEHEARRTIASGFGRVA
jgi:hypothetical protein